MFKNMKCDIIANAICILAVLSNGIVCHAQPQLKKEIMPGVVMKGLNETPQGLPESTLEEDNTKYVPVDYVYLNVNSLQNLKLQKSNTTITFSVSVTSPDSTELRTEIKPDDLKAVAFASEEKLRKVLKGQTTSFSFNAIGVQTGVINIINSNNKVIASTRYRVSPYKSVRQSISTGLTSNVNVIGGDFDNGPNLNVNYSRSDDSGWSGSVGASGGPSGASVNVNSSWSW